MIQVIDVVETLHFHYKSGALTCDSYIEGVTQDLLGADSCYMDDSVKFYGGRYFVCETISKSAAKTFAELLGGVLEE